MKYVRWLWQQSFRIRWNSLVRILTGIVQVVLSKNTTYEGESTITARGRTVEDDFGLSGGTAVQEWDGE